MRVVNLLIALCLALGMFLAEPTLAQERYQLEPTHNGTLRLDRQSGEVSYCRMIGSGIVCTMAADERGLMLQANQELAKRVEELEKRLSAIEGKQDVSQTDTITTENNVESEKNSDVAEELENNQIDKAMRVTEAVMRRFIIMFKDLNRELENN